MKYNQQGRGIGTAINNQRKELADAKKKQAAAEQKYADEINFQKLQEGSKENVTQYRQMAAEKRAGVDAPSYEGTRSRLTGELIDQFKYDPYKGEATQKLKSEAFGTETSPWANMQLQQQEFEQQQGMGQAAKQQAQAQAQAQAGLMRQGGLGGGARALLASRGAKDLMLAQQNIAGQGTAARLGIQSGDLQRKQSLMGDFAKQEGQAQAGNIDTMTQDVNRKAMFDANRYGKAMEVYGAERTAAGQAASAPKGKK